MPGRTGVQCGIRAARFIRLAMAALAVACSAAPGHAGAPDWMKAASVEEGLEAFPDRDLVQLLDEARVEVTREGRQKYEVRRVFHVRQGSGEDVSAFELLDGPYRRVRRVEAWHQDVSGDVKRHRDVIRTTLLDQELYSETQRVVLRVPRVGPGSLVGISMEWEDTWTQSRTIRWPAGGALPIVRAGLSLTLPDGWESQGFVNDSYHDGWQEISPDTTLNRESRYRRFRIDPPHKHEPAAAPLAEQVPLVIIRYRDPHADGAGRRGLWEWSDVVSWYAPFTTGALAGTSEMAALTDGLTDGAYSHDDRLGIMGEFVRDRIGYVQIYLKDGGWRPHPAVTVLANRYGDCKDMAHLNVAMLRLAGIRAWPALVSVGDRRLTNPDFPANHFDHVIVAFERQDGSLGFGDPTVKTLPFGALPHQLEGAWALIINEELDTPLVQLPGTLPQDNVLSRRALLEVGEHGIRGTFEEVLTGHWAGQYRQARRGIRQERYRQVRQDMLQATIPGVRIESIHESGLDAVTDSVRLVFELTAPSVGRRVGSLVLVQPDPITSQSQECFQSSTRRRSLDFGYAWRMDTVVEISHPAGWTVDALPPDAEFGNEIGLFRRTCVATPGGLRLERTAELKTPRVPVAEYPSVRAWAQASCAGDAELVTLRIP